MINHRASIILHFYIMVLLPIHSRNPCMTYITSSGPGLKTQNALLCTPMLHMHLTHGADSFPNYIAVSFTLESCCRYTALLQNPAALLRLLLVQALRTTTKRIIPTVSRHLPHGIILQLLSQDANPWEAGLLLNDSGDKCAGGAHAFPMQLPDGHGILTDLGCLDRCIQQPRLGFPLCGAGQAGVG